MKLRVTFAALLVFATQLIAASSDWAAVMSLPPGRAVVVSFSKQTAAGTLAAVSADQIVVKTNKGEVTAARADVKRVWITGHRRGRNVLIGSAIGAGAAIGPGLVFRTYYNNEVGGGGKALAAMLAIGVGIGAALGAAGGGRELIYKAQP